MKPQAAPQWETSHWFNSEPVSVDDFRGRVVALGSFQMLCPGCVANGLPQLQRIEQTFNRRDVAVVALHTVFEHHAAMTPISLEAFLLEYGIAFPVGVDSHDDPNGPSITMQRYGLRGTPSLVLIDRQGFIRHSSFGFEPDLAVGARIAQLVGETVGVLPADSGEAQPGLCPADGQCR